MRERENANSAWWFVGHLCFGVARINALATELVDRKVFSKSFEVMCNKNDKSQIFES